MLSLSQLKQLHTDGIEYATKNTPWFFPPINDLVELQKTYIKNAKTLNQFMSAVSMDVPSFLASFDVPEPICDNCVLATTQPQYGQGNYGWFFFVGNFYLAGKKMAYNIVFTRVEIAPPASVKLQDRNEAVRWSIMGGYGSGPDDWTVIPYDFVYMKYTKLGYSTFTLKGEAGEYIKNCYLQTTQPMTMEFSVDFLDMAGKQHSIQATQVSRTPPQSNAPNTLVKFGLPGLASLYWSYTSMDVIAVINGGTYSGGKGGMDHQTFKIGGVQGFMPHLFTIFSGIFYSG